MNPVPVAMYQPPSFHSRFHMMWHGNTLPEEPDAPVVFQCWNEFDELLETWCPIRSDWAHIRSAAPERRCAKRKGQLVLTTWNMNNFMPCHGSRALDLINDVLNPERPTDIIFLQEANLAAVAAILADPRVQRGWYSSEGAARRRRGPFTTMTLVSKATFGTAMQPVRGLALGPLWRVEYTSRQQRDALCCDILFPPAGRGPCRRIRLINVHLDSKPTEPSCRPRQLAVAANLVRDAGQGIVAGTFSPCLAEDALLVERNGLTDAWLALRSQDPGYTCGLDNVVTPPRRTDKVATMGLELLAIKTLRAGPATQPGQPLQPNGSRPFDMGGVRWSDHSGLRFVFSMTGGYWCGRDSSTADACVCHQCSSALDCTNN